MKILITGGAGYIGTQLCNTLVDDYDITVLDYFWFGNHLNDKIKRIKYTFTNQSARLCTSSPLL